MKRKKVWAELEREQDEIKRNIKSLMKTAPESRVIDDPMLADRVRNVRYEPVNYNHEEMIYADKKKEKLKGELKREEQPPAIKKQTSDTSKSSNPQEKKSSK